MSLSEKIQQSMVKLQPVKPYQPEVPPKTASKHAMMSKQRTLPARMNPPKILPRTKTHSISGDIMEGITIKDLVQRFSHLIPFCATVVAGNMDYVPTINTGDTLIVHAIKESQVVTISDNQDVKYSVPIHSSAEFGFIGNLDSEEYMCTFSATELMEAGKLPPVVACLADYKGRDDSMSFKQFEILLLKEVTNTFKSYRRVRVIKAYSITDSKTKYIAKEANVFFSSEPSSIKMHLTEIMEHASHLLPCRARIFVPQEYRSLLGDLADDSVVIEKKSTDTSLLACRVNSSSRSKTYVEISASIPLAVALSTESVKTRKQDLDENKYTTLAKRKESLSGCLLKMTRSGFETQGNTTRAPKCSGSDKDVSEPEDSGDEYETVCSVSISSSNRPKVETSPKHESDSGSEYDDVVWYNGRLQPATAKNPTEYYDVMVWKDGETGMTVEPNTQTKRKPDPPKKPTALSASNKQRPAVDGPPSVLPKSTAAKQLQSRRSLAKSTSSLVQLQQEESTHTKPPPPPIPKRRQSKLSTSSTDIRADSVDTQESSTENSGQDGRELSKPAAPPDNSVKEPSANTLETVQAALSSLMKTMKRFEEKHSEFEERLAKIESTSKLTQQSSTKERNTTIASMTQADIQNMLEELGMTQYQEAFSREWIDGEVFKELDEVALRELGVTSRLDQIRLKKVISKGHV